MEQSLNLCIYEKSKLFTSWSSDDIDSLKKVFNDEIAKLNLSVNEIENLIFNYENVKYDKFNIRNYVKLIFFFDFDILQEFTNFIIHNYLYLIEYIDEGEAIYNAFATKIDDKEINIFEAVNILKKFNKNKISICKIIEKLCVNKHWSMYVIFNNVYSIPDGVTHLIIDNGCNNFIKIPNGITHLIFGDNYNYPTIIPQSVTHLVFGKDYNQPTSIPQCVTHLIFGDNYNQPTTIPQSVRYLIFGDNYNQPTNISQSVTYLVFGKNYNQPTDIPQGFTHAFIGTCSDDFPVISPKKYLIFGEKYNKPIKIPNSVTHLSINPSTETSRDIISNHITNLSFPSYITKYIMPIFVEQSNIGNLLHSLNKNFIIC